LEELFYRKKGKTIFNHLLTSIPKQHIDCVELFSLYNKRQFIESEIKENEQGLSIDNLRTGKFWSIYAFLYIAASVFNLFSLFKEKALADTGLENLGLVEITDKLMNIPGKIEQKKRITKLLPSLP
jgi:IS4 transposase